METEERVVVGTIQIPQEVTQELVDDTLCTALDYGYGGSLYWIESLAATEEEGMKYPFEAVSRGGEILIKVSEGGGYHGLRLDKFLKGLELYGAMAGGATPAQIEDSPVDADGADAILQLALFGEIVFG